LPLYAYRCTQCGYEHEKVQKFSDAPETVCPKCGGAVERPLTAPALQFKGAGWYINDYAPKPASGGAAKNASDGASKPASDSSSDTASSTTASGSTTAPAAPTSSKTGPEQL
jgi:putative FmdB family regulatory protein